MARFDIDIVTLGSLKIARGSDVTLIKSQILASKFSDNDKYVELTEADLDKIINEAKERYNPLRKNSSIDLQIIEDKKSLRRKYAYASIAGVAIAGAGIVSGAALPMMSYAVMSVLISGIVGGTLMTLAGFTASLKAKLTLSSDKIDAEINTIEQIRTSLVQGKTL